MKKIHFITLFFLIMYVEILTPGCATSPVKDPWSFTDRILLSTALALHGSDWMQTREGVVNQGMKEGNIFLGNDPDEQDIDLYFASTAAGMSVLSANTSKGWRRVILIGWCFIEVICVMHNDSKGFRISI